MKSYFLKFNGRKEGPYSETQVGQMFADKRVDRSTPCKPAVSGDWRTIDDHLPTLKYGTQLSAPSTSSVSSRIPALPGPIQGVQRITITDVDVPFFSVLKMAFKIFAAWLIVLICFVPLILIFWFTVFAGILTFFSGLHR